MRAWRTRPGGLGIHRGAVPLCSIPVGVSMRETSRNSKLAPTKLVSICPSSCVFRDARCYAQNGATGATFARLNAIGGAAHRLRLADQEAHRAFGGRETPQDGGRDGRSGRDLRLRVADDYTSAAGAQVRALGVPCPVQTRGTSCVRCSLCIARRCAIEGS